MTLGFLPCGWLERPPSAPGRAEGGGDWRRRSSPAEHVLSVRTCRMCVGGEPGSDTDVGVTDGLRGVTHGGGILGALLQQDDSELS